MTPPFYAYCLFGAYSRISLITLILPTSVTDKPGPRFKINTYAVTEAALYLHCPLLNTDDTSTLQKYDITPCPTHIHSNMRSHCYPKLKKKN